MRTLILSSLSILSGITTTVHAQHWVPYSFYSFKQTQQKTEKPAKTEDATAAQTPEDQKESIVEGTTDAMIADRNEPEAFFIVDSETAYQSDTSIFYADPNLPSARSVSQKNANQNNSMRARLCTENWWIEGNYLLAWMKKGDIDVPLITTGSASDPVPGAIGQPGTSVFFGNKHYNYHRTSGVKAAMGGFLGTNRSLAFDIGGFWIFSREKHFNIASNATGSPLIARPYFDVRTGTESAQVVSNPGLYSGSSHALIKTQLWGAELNFGYRPCGGNALGDIFFGFRYLRLQEKIKIHDEMMPFTAPSGLSFNGTANAVNAPDTLVDEDLFRTNNDFFGGQLGFKAEFAVNCWLSVDVFGKCAFGVTEEKYKTEGSTTWESATYGNQYTTGGVLVQPNNMVNTKKWRFALVPEGGIDIGIRPFNHLRFLVGYSFLWWSKVVRPGEQINRNVNSGQIPGNAAYFTPAINQPNKHLDPEPFWLQTLNFGVQFDF